MRRKPAALLLVATIACAGMVPAAHAATTPFTLGKAVPEGVYLYIHAVDNVERQAINAKWAEIWQAVHDARIQDDVRDIILDIIPAGEERETFQQVWTQVFDLIAGVEWGELVSKEFVYTARMGFPMPEYLFLMRGAPESAGDNLAGFRKIFDTLVEVSGGAVTLMDTKVYDLAVTTLVIPGVPFRVQLARRGDVIVMGLSRTLFDESLTLLTNEQADNRLIETQRYKAALDALPQPEDSVVFFDVPQMFKGIGGMMQSARAQTGDDEDAKIVFNIITKAIDTFDIFEFVAAVETTEGDKIVTHELTRLKPNGAESPFGRVICQQRSFEKFDQYIPKEATAFAVSTGIDLGAMYKLVINFVRENIPDGESALTQWDAVQEEIGFHVERDLLSWLSGETVHVTLPASSPMPFSQADWVLLVRVRDADTARRQLETWVKKLQSFLAQHDQTLLVADVPVEEANGFRSVTHPLIAMFFKPIYGVHDDQLIIGSSGAAIAKCLATARGDHPSVSANERVQKEGLLPKGRASCVSFTDRRSLGQEIGAALGMISMGLGMAGTFNQEPEAATIFQGISKIIGKLSPIVAKIDFMSSSASATTFDGRAWMSKSVTTYRLAG